MLQFSCSHCNALITISTPNKNESVICPACKTAQPIPDDAMALPNNPKPTTPLRPAYSYDAPTFPLANVLGALFIILGFAGVAVCLVSMFWYSTSILGIASCISFVAFGVILHLLRDIAMTVESIRRG